MGSRSNVNKGKQPAYDLNAKRVNDEFGSDCTICLEPINKDDDRTLVKLQCGHMFHLDCIGSAFNAKNNMQCPNCRNVEPGRWLYATSLPLTNFSVEDRVAEFRHQFSTDLVFGMEVCPFRAFGHLNLFVQPNAMGPNIFSHEPRVDGDELCPYIEYNAINSRPIVAVGDTSSRNVPNPYSLHANQLDQISNPSHLVPVSLLPTNPRIFRNVSHPEVVRARHYFAHPFIDHSSNGYSTSTANVPQFPSYLSSSLVAGTPVFSPGNLVTNAIMGNAPITWPYQGDNLWANALLANPTMAPPYQVVPPLMGGLPTAVIHSLMFPFGWGQLARGVTDFLSTPYGLSHMMYGGGSITNMGSGGGSTGRVGNNGEESTRGGESSSDISGGSGRSSRSRESGSNGGGPGGENRNNIGEHRSERPS